MAFCKHFIRWTPFCDEYHLKINPRCIFFTFQILITMLHKLLLLTVLAGIVTFSACKKEDDSGQDRTTAVHIRLTDDPCDCQQVNIDIKEIQIKTSEDTSQWIPLSTNGGIYDLLQYQNDVDTLIATGMVPADVVLKEVRFILGDSNTVMVDSVMHDLQTPSAQSSGLKIKIEKSLGLTVNTFVLDFDAAESVKDQNGKYKLEPVIRLK